MPRALHRLDASTILSGDDLRDALAAMSPAVADDALLVVGPFARVERDLLEVVDRARARDDTYRSILDGLGRRHLALADALPDAARTPALVSQLQEDTRDLADTCHALRSGGDGEVARALALSCGALWASRLVEAGLRARGVDVRWRDPAEVLRVGSPDARQAASDDDALAPWRDAAERCTVAPGGRAADEHGAPVHLRPDGLDRGAALLGALLVARSVTLWHRDASREELTLAEAGALADVDPALGAPALWAPAIDAGASVGYRGFTDNLPAGLLRDAPGPRPARLRTRRGLTLVVVTGAFLHEIPHAARTLAQCLRDADAPPSMLAAAAPGEPLAALIRSERAGAAVERIRKAFLWEDRAFHAQEVHRVDDVALLRLVGARAPGEPYRAIARAGGEVVMAAQPPLGVSLSLAVRAPDLDAVEASVRDAIS